MIASPWTPQSDDPLFVWAASTAQARTRSSVLTTALRSFVLASLTVEVRQRPRAGERHVVAVGRSPAMGASTSQPLRSTYAAGGVLAVADALWIELRDPAASVAQPRAGHPFLAPCARTSADFARYVLLRGLASASWAISRSTWLDL